MELFTVVALLKLLVLFVVVIVVGIVVVVVALGDDGCVVDVMDVRLELAKKEGEADR